MRKPALALLGLVMLVVAACSGSPAPSTESSPSAATGSLPQGLIAYVGASGVGVLDPADGRSKLVAPLPPGAFRVAGPVWGPAPGVSHPVLYLTVHDDRPAESRTAPGVVPYDWLFRVDPFAGTIDPIAASEDSQSEGPIGLVANSHYLGLTVGCCATYEVDTLDLTRPPAALRTLSKPPSQAAFFTQGIAPGASGLIAVRAFGTGAWYWLNADASVLNPFPISLGPDDGPIAIAPDGTMVAVALPDHGATIRPFTSALPVASPSANSPAATTPTPTPRATPFSGVRQVNSTLHHPDGLAWSPDARQLAVAVNGELEMYRVGAADGPPATRYLVGGGVVGVAWSGPIDGATFDAVKPDGGPQAIVDALLTATRLPAQADTPANRPLTTVYLWQFDSTKPSPIETITDATPAILAKYPPLAAGVVFHHWAASDTWALLGGCYRYRVVIGGSIAPVASTFGLAGNAPCSARASATPSPS